MASLSSGFHSDPSSDWTWWRILWIITDLKDMVPDVKWIWFIGGLEQKHLHTLMGCSRCEFHPTNSLSYFFIFLFIILILTLSPCTTQLMEVQLQAKPLNKEGKGERKYAVGRGTQIISNNDSATRALPPALVQQSETQGLVTWSLNAILARHGCTKVSVPGDCPNSPIFHHLPKTIARWMCLFIP